MRMDRPCMACREAGLVHVQAAARPGAPRIKVFNLRGDAEPLSGACAPMHSAGLGLNQLSSGGKVLSAQSSSWLPLPCID